MLLPKCRNLSCLALRTHFVQEARVISPQMTQKYPHLRLLLLTFQTHRTKQDLNACSSTLMARVVHLQMALPHLIPYNWPWTGSLLLKRSHPDSELDPEHLNGGVDFKRYKKEDVRKFLRVTRRAKFSTYQDGYNQGLKSVASHLSSPETVSVRSVNPNHTPEHATPLSYEHSHRPMSPMNDNCHCFANNSGGLTRLLGCDVDAYVEDHEEKYERCVERWKGCTIEEWITGAEGAFCWNKFTSLRASCTWFRASRAIRQDCWFRKCFPPLLTYGPNAQMVQGQRPYDVCPLVLWPDMCSACQSML